MRGSIKDGTAGGWGSSIKKKNTNKILLGNIERSTRSTINHCRSFCERQVRAKNRCRTARSGLAQKGCMQPPPMIMIHLHGPRRLFLCWPGVEQGFWLGTPIMTFSRKMAQIMNTNPGVEVFWLGTPITTFSRKMTQIMTYKSRGGSFWPGRV